MANLEQRITSRLHAGQARTSLFATASEPCEVKSEDQALSKVQQKLAVRLLDVSSVRGQQWSPGMYQKTMENLNGKECPDVLRRAVGACSFHSRSLIALPFPFLALSQFLHTLSILWKDDNHNSGKCFLNLVH